jgi:hypothetical protein
MGVNGRTFRVAMSKIMMLVGAAKASSRPSAVKADASVQRRGGYVFVWPSRNPGFLAWLNPPTTERALTAEQQINCRFSTGLCPADFAAASGSQTWTHHAVKVAIARSSAETAKALIVFVLCQTTPVPAQRGDPRL